MPHFCTFSEGKNSLMRDKRETDIYAQAVNQLFTNKKLIADQ